MCRENDQDAEESRDTELLEDEHGEDEGDVDSLVGKDDVDTDELLFPLVDPLNEVNEGHGLYYLLKLIVIVLQTMIKRFVSGREYSRNGIAVFLIKIQLLIFSVFIAIYIFRMRD